MLACHKLELSVQGRTLVRDMDLSVLPGQVLAILGQNGAGKTLTLHTLAGLRDPARGEVHLDKQPMAQLSRRDIARKLGLLLQTYEDPFPGTVLETALVGRHPHIGFWQWESAADLIVARQALADMGLASLQERDIHTLSGGERRRLAIAALLAQQPCVYLMDEPLNHLDPQHQLQVLRLFKDLADNGKTVIMALHDANAAMAWCSHALLLHGDGSWQYGPCTDVLSDGNLSRLYQTPVTGIEWNGKRYFAMN